MTKNKVISEISLALYYRVNIL